MLKSMVQVAEAPQWMEVSSHGDCISTGKGINLEIATFMNLTRDHLDYHGSMEEYYREKKAV